MRLFDHAERPARGGLVLVPLLGLAILSGCEEDRNVKPAKDMSIINKRTQDIKKADAELEKKGAVVRAEGKITAKDPITLQGNAYVTIIGQTAILSIQHAMDLYHAMNDRYPKDYDEFMAEIIKANNIALPKLPFYQEYRYDEKEHKLVIYEYPDRKAGPLPKE